MRYLARFPEDLFQPIENIEYSKTLLKGELICSRSKVLICGICRNISKVFPLTRMRMEAIGRMFSDYEVFVYENDSDDGTKDLLKEWSKSNKRVNILLENYQKEWYNEGHDSRRMKAMAYARNKYVQYSSLKEWDYLIVVDMDVLGGYSYDGIKHSIGFMPEKSFVGANSLLYRERDEKFERVYYDSFAYRDVHIHHHTSDQEKNLIWYNRGEDPIPVMSCFGGIGIYNIPLERYEDWDCEHVTMHKKMFDKGVELYMNPNLITVYTDTIYSSIITGGKYIGLGLSNC